ncbi:phosphotransferase family protein [Alsobacter soli]|uniref:Phosphotransferase family protein n=1 Tax=Alsobacter soli TaxID=2109933 RepID=A0A2T1HZA6_9HYPH|nr:phosphotransferase [Alsobacter soli]PSC07033.1 phosphotransferase family protein [Alsobacter soli]
MSGTVAALDEAALARWMEAHVPGFRGPLSAEKFPGGQSNPTFRITAGSGAYVLRRKPPGQLLKSAHAVDREFRVISALAQTDVPVPKALALCTDESVLGTLFYVMEEVRGRVFWDPAMPDSQPDERAAVYDAMNAALAALHSVDVQAIGLADFGKSGDYFARQVARWSEQYRASETQPIPAMDRLIAWLGENRPPDDGRMSLVHGDYRIDNMIFAPHSAKLLAIIDWELSTLGHPFSDLAYQCMQWRLPHEGDFRGLAGVDRSALGIPTEEAYVAAYCRRMGLDGIPTWTFCLAFSFFRLAAILQGVLKRVLDGNASNPEHGLKMGRAVPLLAQMACDLVEARG